MAIFGAGSKWDKDEMSNDFFEKENFRIGWDINDAKDLHSQMFSIKAGDIIYLKANRVGSLDLRIKGIGVVLQSFANQRLIDGQGLSQNTQDFKLPVKWIIKDEFHINIPSDIGKLTNVRAATLYEEFLPFVHVAVLNKIFSHLNL